MKWYEYTDGVITGRYSDPLEGLVELPDDHPDVEAFLNPPPPPIVSVTARQFKMQLVIAGLKAQVDGWVAEQEEIVQVAYEYSGNFFKDEPMMQAGFEELGFTEEQRDAFFLAASKL